MKPSACLKPKAVAIREEVSSARPSAPIGLSEAYEALAHAYRYKDWNSLAAASADQIRRIMLDDQKLLMEAVSRLSQRLSLDELSSRYALTLRAFSGIVNKPSNAFRRCIETETGLELGWFMDSIPRTEHEGRIDPLRGAFGIDPNSIDAVAHRIERIPADYLCNTWISRSQAYAGPRSLLSVGVQLPASDLEFLNHQLDKEGCVPTIQFVDGQGIPSRRTILVHGHWNPRQLLLAGNGEVGNRTILAINELVQTKSLAVAFKAPPKNEVRQRLGVYLLRADLAQRPSIAGILPRGITLESLDRFAQVQR